ncbi:hypothetical protein DL770_003958 [Monosporascus sp. CRB-9-2]|nr:hypothetical protein DL770_003958 [Monosporascus sp. CRB-9-2]
MPAADGGAEGGAPGSEGGDAFVVVAVVVPEEMYGGDDDDDDDDTDCERATAAADAGGSGDSVKVGTPLSLICVAEAFGVVCGEHSAARDALPFSFLIIVALSPVSPVSAPTTIAGVEGVAEASGTGPPAHPSSPACLRGPGDDDDGGGIRVVGGCSILGSPRHSASSVSIKGGLRIAT